MAFSEATEAGLSLQQLAKLGQRPGIQHVVCREPGTPRLIDSEPHTLECIDGVRIGRDRQLDPGEFRGVSMKIVQIEAIRLRIDLEVAAGFTRGRDHEIHVDVVRLARARTTRSVCALSENHESLILKEISHGSTGRN